MSDNEDNVPWECQLTSVAAKFGEECARLRDTNPYADTQGSTPLGQVILFLATELWDHNFGIDEIKLAFSAAVDDLPRYAAGWNKRSDEVWPKK